MSIPTSLKPISHYIKIANEHKERDPAVYYWCLYYAVQLGMKIDKSSPEAKAYLVTLLDTLEQVKKALSSIEAVTNEMVAEAHLEEYILRLFVAADKQDRSGVFNKNVVKAFYTSGMLFDTLTLFGDGQLNEKFAEQQKYAKWKSAYIHQCLKNGETPVPGPPGGIHDEEDEDLTLDVPDPSDRFAASVIIADDPPLPQPSAATGPMIVPDAEPSASAPAAGGGGGPALTHEHYTKATKHCRSAISAMQYEDAPAAVDQLVAAMRILQTGRL